MYVDCVYCILASWFVLWFRTISNSHECGKLLPQCHKQVSFGDDFYHPFVVSHGEWPSIIYPCMCWSNPVKTPCLLVKPHQHLNKKSMFFPLRIQQVAASQETFRCGSTHQQEMFLSIWYYMRYVYPNVHKYSNIYVNIHV